MMTNELRELDDFTATRRLLQLRLVRELKAIQVEQNAVEINKLQRQIDASLQHLQITIDTTLKVQESLIKVRMARTKIDSKIADFEASYSMTALPNPSLASSPPS